MYVGNSHVLFLFGRLQTCVQSVGCWEMISKTHTQMHKTLVLSQTLVNARPRRHLKASLTLTFLISGRLGFHHENRWRICIKNGEDLQGNYNYKCHLNSHITWSILHLHIARPRHIREMEKQNITEEEDKLGNTNRQIKGKRRFSGYNWLTERKKKQFQHSVYLFDTMIYIYNDKKQCSSNIEVCKCKNSKMTNNARRRPKLTLAKH